jgi:hypothetical protein
MHKVILECSLRWTDLSQGLSEKTDWILKSQNKGASAWLLTRTEK